MIYKFIKRYRYRYKIRSIKIKCFLNKLTSTVFRSTNFTEIVCDLQIYMHFEFSFYKGQ